MIQHTDPEIQSIIETLENQRDTACVTAARKHKEATEAIAALSNANAEIGRLNEALAAAAKFQGGNVIDLKAERVVDEGAAA